MGHARTTRGHFRGATFCVDGTWSLRGELDAATLDAFGDELEAMARRVAGVVVIDMSGVRYCDAAGVRLLHRVAGACKQTIVLRALPARVRNVLVWCEVEHHFILEAAPTR